MKGRLASRPLAVVVAWALVTTNVQAQKNTWRPPAAPDDALLQSEQMIVRGVVKVVGRWEDGSVETGAGLMLGYEGNTLYLLTASHVIRKAESGKARDVFVQFFGDAGQRYSAGILRNDVPADVAVLVLPGFYEQRHLDRLVKYPLHLAFPSAGADHPVKAIGHPDDRDWHVSHGTAAPAANPDELSLTATMVRHGNSGGPLLSADNRLVGVVTGGEGEQRSVALGTPAVIRTLEGWDIPYRTRVVESLDTVLEQIRRAAWEEDWKSLRGETLKLDDKNTGVWRARVSLLGSRKAIVETWFENETYIEHLGDYRAAAVLDEAWRVWLRAIVKAIGTGYRVDEKGPRRIAFWKYKAMGWPSSRKVTFELVESHGGIYLLVYRFETDAGPLEVASRYREYLK